MTWVGYVDRNAYGKNGTLVRIASTRRNTSVVHRVAVNRKIFFFVFSR